MPDPRSIGKRFEDLAAEHLARLGFTLVTRRFTCRGGEIDLVALDGETLVFVEVKGRTSGFSTPEQALTDRKRSRLFAAARKYLAQAKGIEREVRFDLIVFDASGIRHHRDAFRPE